MELYVPETLAGVAISVPITLDMKQDGCFIYYAELIRCYFMLAMSYALAVFLLLALWEVDEEGIDPDDEGSAKMCANGLFGVQLACVFIYESSVFSELLKVVNIVRLLYNAEGKPSNADTIGFSQLMTPSAPSHGAVMVSDKNESGGKFAKFYRRLRSAPPQEGMPQWTFEKITVCFKVVSVIFVVLPKLLIVISLGYFGGIFVVHCQTIAETCLNTLAVNFILDIDVILYESFVVEETKNAVAQMQAVGVELSNTQRFWSWLASCIIYPMMPMFATIYVVVISQGCGLDHFSPRIQTLLIALRLPLGHPHFKVGSD